MIEQDYEEYAVVEQRVSIGRTITEADIVFHAGHASDYFPHLVDAEFCKKNLQTCKVETVTA